MHFFTSPKIQLLPYCQLILSSHFSSPPYSELGTNWPHSIPLPRCLFGETLLTNLISDKSKSEERFSHLLNNARGFLDFHSNTCDVTFFLQGDVEKCNKLRLAVTLEISFLSPFYCLDRYSAGIDTHDF